MDVTIDTRGFTLDTQSRELVATRAHKLAGLTFQTDQSFGALANRMVDHGLIRRVPGEGRAILHRLTPAGEAMLRDGHVVVNKVLAESLAPLSASERQQLHGLLNRLLDEPAR